MVEEGEDEDRDDTGDEDGARSGHCHRAQELGESRGDRPGLPVPNKPDGFCGRKAALKRKAMSVSVRYVAPRPLAVNHRHVIDPCTHTGQQVCVVSCLLSLVNRSVLSAVCFTGQQACVVSCVLSLVNRSVLSAVCFHWSTGGLFHWSTALCCQLFAFTGQRVAYFNVQRVCVVICVVCVVSCLLSLVNGSVLSAVCFHWPMGLCWQQRGPCCQLFVFTGQLICVVTCLFSVSNGSVLSVVCFHWSTGGLFHWSTDLCCQLFVFTEQRLCVVSRVLSLVNGWLVSLVN